MKIYEVGDKVASEQMLLELPVGTVLRDATGDQMKKLPGGAWIDLPETVHSVPYGAGTMWQYLSGLEVVVVGEGEVEYGVGYFDHYTYRIEWGLVKNPTKRIDRDNGTWYIDGAPYMVSAVYKRPLVQRILVRDYTGAEEEGKK